MWRHNEKVAIYKPEKRPTPGTKSGTLFLGFPTSQIVRNQYLYFKPLNVWCLYMAACVDKMHIFEWSFCIEDSIQVHHKREALVMQVYMILYKILKNL